MTTLTEQLLQAFFAQGVVVRPGDGDVADDPDGEFARAFRADGTPLLTGAGLALGEIALLVEIARQVGGHALVIGNGFGWSAVALGLAMRESGQVVAIDACIEGSDANAGIALVNRAAASLHLPVIAVRGRSPADIPRLALEYFGSRLDLVLIDSLHTDEQQILDYEAVRPFLTPDAVVLFHDVLNWRTQRSFAVNAARDGRGATLLHGTASGMGVLHPETPPYQDLLMALAATRPARADGRVMWARRYADVARAYLDAGDADLSRRYFGRALDVSEDPCALWRERLHQLFDRCDWQECSIAISAARSLRPDWGEPLYWSALVARASGQSSSAIWARFVEAVEAGPVTAALALDAGFAAFSAGAVDEAEALATRAAQVRPDWSQPWHLRALCARERGEASSEVLVLLEQALAARPMTPELAYDAASILHSHGDLTRAEVLARAAVDGRPGWSAAWHLLGLCARARHAPADEVLAIFERALATGPASSVLLADAGFAALSLGALERAEALAQEATRLLPGWSAPRHLHALVARERGESVEVVAALLDDALRTTPISAELAFDAGAAALALGRLDDAAERVRQALAERPDWEAAADLRAVIDAGRVARR